MLQYDLTDFLSARLKYADDVAIVRLGEVEKWIFRFTEDGVEKSDYQIREEAFLHYKIESSTDSPSDNWYSEC